MKKILLLALLIVGCNQNRTTTYAYLPDHTHQETIKEINWLWDYSSSLNE